MQSIEHASSHSSLLPYSCCRWVSRQVRGRTTRKLIAKFMRDLSYQFKSNILMIYFDWKFIRDRTAHKNKIKWTFWLDWEIIHQSNTFFYCTHFFVIKNKKKRRRNLNGRETTSAHHQTFLLVSLIFFFNTF